MQAQAIRRDTALQKFQADLNAITSIGLEPAIPPALPAPRPLPRPTLQKPAKIVPIPKNVEIRAQKTNPFLAGLTAAAPALGSAAVGAFGNIKAPGGGSSPLAVGGNASANYGGAVQQIQGSSIAGNYFQ